MSIGVHGYKYDFFISYAEDSRAWVHGYLLRKLRRAGVNYLLEDDFDQNQPILKEREYAVENSWRTLLILTPRYLVSSDQEIIRLMGFTRRMMGKDQEYPVVPVIYKPIDAGLLLNVVGAVDLTAESEEIRKRELEKLLRKQGIKDSEEQERIEPPYPGMSPFQTHDNAIFFGRELETNQCADYLRANRLLVLTGVSGCGKSSLVKAGIIPRLQKSGEWSVKEVRPSMALGGDLGLLEFDALFPDLKEGQQPLLLVDQFEETFVADDKSETNGQRIGLSTKAKQFLEALSKVLDKAYIIITVRDEFYPQLAWCTQWIDIDPHLRRVDFMGRERLADAIRKPAASLGVHLDDVLVERLLNDAGDDPGILPFVQETMRRLWEQMEERYIDIRDYEALQGYGVAGLKYAIAAKADSAYKNLKTDEHRHIARRIFIRLVQFGEGKPDTRRQLPVAKLQADGDSPSVFEQTLQELSSDNNRLLTLSDRSGNGRTVDIVHESLIKAWPQFQEWLQEFREYDKQRRRLEFKADEWERLGGKQTGLLDAGELTEAKGLLNSPSAQLLGVENRFLTFLKQSELTIDPGWNQAGLISLLVLIFSVIIFFGFAYLMSSAIRSEAIRNTIYLIMILGIGSIFGFLFLLEKKEKHVHLGKRYSHVFSGKYHITGSFLALFMSVFLWGRYAIAEQERLNYCEQEGFQKNNRELKDIGIIINNESDIFLGELLRQTLTLHNGVNVSVIEENISSMCSNAFDYISRVRIANKQDNISYSISIHDINTNKLIPSISVIGYKDGSNDCKIITELGYEFLSSINMGNVLKKIGIDDEGATVVCAAYQDNLFATKAYKANHYAEARKFAMTALKINGDFLLAKNTLGKSYIKLGEYDKAIATFKDIIKNNKAPNKIKIYASLAIALAMKKEFLEAEKWLEMANPDKELGADFYYGLSFLYLKWLEEDNKKSQHFQESMKNLYQTINWASDAATDSPINLINKGNYFKLLGLFHYGKANYKDALINFKEASDSHFTFGEEAGFYQAMSYIGLNDHDSACKAWRDYSEEYIHDHFSDGIDEMRRRLVAEDYTRKCN